MLAANHAITSNCSKQGLFPLKRGKINDGMILFFRYLSCYHCADLKKGTL